MALQLTVQYQDMPITYDVVMQVDSVYHLRLKEEPVHTGAYIPQKIVIRRKGKIWISDLDNYPELVSALTEEILSFQAQNATGNE
jgi:hypothetical protein